MAGFSDAMNTGGDMTASGNAQGMAEQDGFGEDGEPATEEEQQLLDAFMDRVGELLIPEKGKFNTQVLADLRGDIDAEALKMFEGAEPPVDPSNPKDAIAASGVLLLITVDAKMGYQQKANAETSGEAGMEGEQQPGMSDEVEDAQEGESDDPSYAAVLWEAGQQLVGMLADMAEQAGVATLSDDDVGYIWLRATDLYRYASPTLDREAMKGELANMEVAARRGGIPGIPSGAPTEPQMQEA